MPTPGTLCIRLCPILPASAMNFALEDSPPSCSAQGPEAGCQRPPLCGYETPCLPFRQTIPLSVHVLGLSTQIRGR